VGRLFQRLGEARRTLNCYAESIKEHGKRAAITYNLPVCQGELGNRAEALDCFRQAVELTNQKPGRPACSI
jgi:tetratricopeptide (TPR) repeat protein